MRSTKGHRNIKWHTWRLSAFCHWHEWSCERPGRDSQAKPTRPLNGYSLKRTKEVRRGSHYAPDYNYGWLTPSLNSHVPTCLHWSGGKHQGIISSFGYWPGLVECAAFRVETRRGVRWTSDGAGNNCLCSGADWWGLWWTPFQVCVLASVPWFIFRVLRVYGFYSCGITLWSCHSMRQTRCKNLFHMWINWEYFDLKIEELCRNCLPNQWSQIEKLLPIWYWIF